MAVPAVARRAGGNWTRICDLTERPGDADDGDGPCIMPEFLGVDQYRLAVYGYVMPVLALLTVVTNCLVCAVLLRHSMRTPTNVLLVAMAVSDMLTGVSTMPAFVKFFTLGAYVDYMPYQWFVAVYFVQFLLFLSINIFLHHKRLSKTGEEKPK